MTAEDCEQKALQCLQLIQDCADPTAVAVLKKLAEQYATLAEALRSAENKSGKAVVADD
jgi:hypothetical protein